MARYVCMSCGQRGEADTMPELCPHCDSFVVVENGPVGAVQADACPVCGGKVVDACRCPDNDRRCANGHVWTRDRATGAWLVLDRPHGSLVEVIPLVRAEPEAAPGFAAAWKALQRDVHQIALDHGWWETARSEPEIIALLHSELSEALEAVRHGNPGSDHIPLFSGVEEEIADVVIRLMDWAEARGYAVAAAVQAKIDFNRTRPYRHGGKRL